MTFVVVIVLKSVVSTCDIFKLAEGPVQQKPYLAFSVCCFPVRQRLFFSHHLPFLSVYQQDFRDAVSKASPQNGKPVIEDRVLNQMLYSLPQLYELNQNLLLELRQRIAKWYNRVKKRVFSVHDP